MRWFILAILFCVVVNGNAQLSGTFKVSKVAKTTFIEQMSFVSGGAVDITYGDFKPVLSGPLVRTFERVVLESRGTYGARPIAAVLDSLANDTSESIGKLLSLLRTHQKNGYDTFVLVQFKLTSGADQSAWLVRKGSELVNIYTGEIYRKPFWSF